MTNVKDRDAVVEGIIASLNLPPEVVSWRTEFTTDWQGDPIVYVWLIVKDEVAADLKRYSEFIRHWHFPVRDAFLEIFPENYPLIKYRSQTDEREVQEGIF